jgi:phosphoglycerate kinase
MTAFLGLNDAPTRGRRVLVRCDLNLPMRDGRPTDLTRLTRTAETLRQLAEGGARVIILSHFGRPKGRDPALSLAPLVAPLAEAVGRPVAFAEDCVGPVAQAAVDGLSDGGLLLLENLRFHVGEEANDPTFIAALAALGDLWVNDAFSAAHRAHASTAGLGTRLPAFAGLAMQAELEALDKALGSPARPVVAVVGGAKVSTKLDLLGNLVQRVDALIVGGAMANTFLLAQGAEIGRSLAEPAMVDTARAILAAAERGGCRLSLPNDAVVADRLAPGAVTQVVASRAVPTNTMILDVGPASIAAFAHALERARTLVWNGPLGAFETPPFDAGTRALASHAAALTKVAVGLSDGMTYVSTAGGAFLEWMEGKTLPGVAALAV